MTIMTTTIATTTYRCDDYEDCDCSDYDHDDQQDLNPQSRGYRADCLREMHEAPGKPICPAVVLQVPLKFKGFC